MQSRVQSVSARVEELLAALGSGEFGGAAPAAEELVRLLVGLYGEGIAQIVAVLREAGEAGEAIWARLAQDPVVEGLLLVHDLHPLDAATRVQQALDRIRPYLGSHAGGVEFLGIDDGVARLRLEGSCHGCPSSAATVELAITGAVMDAAPEVSDVHVEGMTAPAGPALLQIGPRPPGAGEPAGGPAGSGAGWAQLPDLGPPSSRPVAVTAAGMPVIVCAVRGTLYAYADGCAACGSPLAAGTLDRELLTCPSCGARFDLQKAGAAVTGTGTTGHLHPLPLLADSHGVRVAVPEPA